MQWLYGNDTIIAGQLFWLLIVSGQRLGIVIPFREDKAQSLDRAGHD
jgi:hypothetical protein